MIYKLRIKIKDVWYRLETEPLAVFRAKERVLAKNQDAIVDTLIAENGRAFLEGDLNQKEGMFMRGHTARLSLIYQMINLHCDDDLIADIKEICEGFEYELVDSGTVILSSNGIEPQKKTI